MSADERRSTKAGASTPATPPGTLLGPRAKSTLNEGRGINPGDTARSARQSSDTGRAPGLRSTKARVSTPATHSVLLGELHVPIRSTKAGASTPATLDGFVIVVVVSQRSTKAGASTPATRRRSSLLPPRPATLNEGRGINPGDTSTSDSNSVGLTGRSTKAGASTPATLQARVWRWRPRKRSTKAGASTPATLHVAIVKAADGRGAQRRPGHQPRRHC